MIGEDEKHTQKGDTHANEGPDRHPLAEKEMTANRDPERHDVHHECDAPNARQLHRQKNQDEFASEQQPGGNSGPERAITLEKRNTAPVTPEKNAQATERSTPRCHQHGIEPSIADLDGNLIEPPAEHDEHDQHDGQSIERNSSLGRSPRFA